MRAVAATTSSQGVCSPSAYPSDQATPPLVVAIASKPAATKTLALIASQAFGSSSNRCPRCLARNSSACCACSAGFISQLPGGGRRRVGSNLFLRTTEVKLTKCALIGDRNAVDLCHKRLIGNSCKFPEDSLFRGWRTHYTRKPGRSEGGGCDEHRCWRGGACRAGRCPVSLRIPQDLAEIFSWAEQARALACPVFGQMQPARGRFMPLASPHALRAVRHRYPDVHRTHTGLRERRFYQGFGRGQPALRCFSFMSDRRHG